MKVGFVTSSQRLLTCFAVL